MIHTRIGKKGHNVQSWQMALNKTKPKNAPMLVEDAIFGPKTLKATIAKQRNLGVSPDGIVGPITYKAFKSKYPFISVSFIPASHSDAKNFDARAIAAGRKLIAANRKRGSKTYKIVDQSFPEKKKSGGIVIPAMLFSALYFL